MQRLMTLLLGLMLAGSYLTSTAAPGPTAGVQPPSQHARGHDDGGGGNRVNVERKKKNKKKNKKRKKSKAPTCFGLPATIDEHSGEIAGTDFDDVIIGDAGANTVVSGDGIGRICTGGSEG